MGARSGFAHREGGGGPVAIEGGGDHRTVLHRGTGRVEH